VNKYESLVQTLTNEGVSLRKSIKALEEEAEKYIAQHPTDEAFKQISKQQVNGLSTQLAICTNDFFKSQSQYHNKMKDRLKLQLQAKGEDVSEDRFNDILSADSYNIFTQNFISEQADAEQTLRELEERHKDILALEKSVTEVNQLFKEMNLLVSQQGDKLDSIEANIDNVEVTVQAGNEQLSQAVVNQRKARRKKFCCFIIIGVVVAIVITIVAVVISQSV
jgi:t-SNARE complex subunit (syntaxin)